MGTRGAPEPRPTPKPRPGNDRSQPDGLSPIPLAEAKRLVRQYGYDQVVIVARKTGERGMEHVATFGADRKHCDIAAMIGDYLKYEIMNWVRNTGD